MPEIYSFDNKVKTPQGFLKKHYRTLAGILFVYLIQSTLKHTFPKLQADYTRLLFNNKNPVKLQYESHNRLRLEWIQAIKGMKSKSLLHLIIYCPSKNEVVMKVEQYSKNRLTSFSLPEHLMGYTLHYYFFFSNKNHPERSSILYLGHTPASI